MGAISAHFHVAFPKKRSSQVAELLHGVAGSPEEMYYDEVEQLEAKVLRAFGLGQSARVANIPAYLLPLGESKKQRMLYNVLTVMLGGTGASIADDMSVRSETPGSEGVVAE